MFDVVHHRIRGRLAGKRFNLRGLREFSSAVRSF